MARGGKRTPASPAPVSGPGELSQRTDGGQPVRDLPGGTYGENVELREQQAVAPLPQQGGMAGGGGASGGAPPPPGVDIADLFGPTGRPEEPITEGAAVGPGGSGQPLLGDDPYMTLRALYAAHPYPGLRDLLLLAESGGR